MIYLSHLRCTECGSEYPLEEVRYLCPICSRDYQAGMPLKGVMEVLFDYAAIGTAWREYLEKYPDAGTVQKMDKLNQLFSPVDSIYYPNLPVGNTPLIATDRLSSRLLYLKYDGVNPSASFKDRASQLVVAEATRLGIKEIVTASTGNAASSLAALCASAGIKAVIFAPKKAPKAKLVQMIVHGATLNQVDGTYDDAFAAALEYSAHHECLNRNTAYHPYTIEGKKTAGLELFIQMDAVPDQIYIPTGDGVILAGIYKAFIDLMRAGITDRMPALIACQAESSDAITSYWENGSYQDACAPHTVADSISVKTPSAAHLAYQALVETSGMGIRVSDTEILEAQSLLARKSGIFCEPSSAATFAAFLKAQALGETDDAAKVVLMLTGHGLKDIQAVKFDS